MGERRILLADDHPLVREGLQLAIRSRNPGAAIDAVDSIAAAQRVIRDQRRYDLMLLRPVDISA